MERHRGTAGHRVLGVGRACGVGVATAGVFPMGLCSPGWPCTQRARSPRAAWVYSGLWAGSARHTCLGKL